ncbi:aKG-HExxH-type peptide beta-hydroxylase [Pseudoalteromonas spongiae]|uniref:aKG-HExxH-type peptide beta-hydroxylase n=1 Tax=Pseudoalteromonas spongiae TaxID=298657 RepID=UPI00110A85EA|nr:HEXXH motif-containing putative peptide modification protein [Pseudoalteromonas spongiae]TMO84321.1 hypothetical protein CWC15_12005 [Pseudoalteromonas spongiae]
MKVMWDKMARPQIDEYDSFVTLQLAAINMRKNGSNSNITSSQIYFADNSVEIGYITENAPGTPFNINAQLKMHDNIISAENYLRNWKTGFNQFKRIINTFHPMTSPKLQECEFGLGLGSSSHSLQNTFGKMYATIYDPLGLAQAFVHELAHNKLRALGINNDRAKDFILNSDQELYFSPVVNTDRPLPAILHATYSFTYVLALDIAILNHSNCESTNRIISKLLQKNSSIVSYGLNTLKANLNLTEIGYEFLEGFYSWANELLSITERHIGEL